MKNVNAAQLETAARTAYRVWCRRCRRSDATPWGDLPEPIREDWRVIAAAVIGSERRTR